MSALSSWINSEVKFVILINHFTDRIINTFSLFKVWFKNIYVSTFKQKEWILIIRSVACRYL